MILTTRLIAFSLVAVFMLAIGATPADAQQVQFGVPQRIKDADTVTINGVNVRLFGIDAPETDQFCLDAQSKRWPCGERALDQLKKKIAGKPWTCRGSGQDVYKRLLAVCHVEGEDINQWLVRSGLALSYKRYSHKYDADETAARTARTGLWSGAFIAPWDWRHKNKSTVILGAMSVPIDAQKHLLPPEPPVVTTLTEKPEPTEDPTPTTTVTPVSAPPVQRFSPSTSTPRSASPRTGSCQNPDDRAADGSRCGGRAASERKNKR